MIQAATGLAATLGQAGEDEPRYLPITIADRSVGIYAFGVICAALYARDRTGAARAWTSPCSRP
jgi:crotonobetainyl-CoA:carnitine CoA-transferase CaiB-like acyl-CoA transferase